jgi:hypothetical protein
MATANSPKPISDMGRFLEDRARANTPIFYNDLAPVFGLPPVDEFWLSHPLCKIFGDLDDEDHRLGRPFRTAAVVSRDKNVPGEGFFSTLERARGIRLPRNDLERIRVWTEEFSRLVEFASRKQ